MKKKITFMLSTIAIAASVIVFNQGFAAESSGSQVLKTYATENEVSNDIQVTQDNGFSYNSIDASKKNVRIPLDLASQKPRGITAVNSTAKSDNEDPIVTREYAQSVVNPDQTETAIVRYETENGIPITISQSENPYGIEEGIDLVKSWYDPSVTEETEINGHKAVIENSNRKHVHIITEDTLYTVNSVGANNLDQLIEIAKQINIE